MHVAAVQYLFDAETESRGAISQDNKRNEQENGGGGGAVMNRWDGGFDGCRRRRTEEGGTKHTIWRSVDQK